MSWQYFTPGEGNRPLITDEPKTLLKKICNNVYDLVTAASTATWGTITGVITAQEDLMAIFNALHGYGTVSVSTAGTTQITIPNYTKVFVQEVLAGTGAGLYTRNIDLESTNRRSGDIAEIPIIFTASTNQTIVIRDGVSDASLIGAGQVGNGTVYTSLVRCYFDGTNWKLLSWGA